MSNGNIFKLEISPFFKNKKNKKIKKKEKRKRKRMPSIYYQNQACQEAFDL
jgi:hypothetical protein